LRGFLRATGRALLVLAGVFAVGLAALYSAGTVYVYVHEKRPGGHRLWLPIPALAVTEGIRLAPEKDLRKETRSWQPYLPAIGIASQALERCADTRLIEVEDASDHVLIQTRGSRLVIDVDSKDATVPVSFPLRMAGAVAEELRQQGGTSGTI
jgi:hypothetical protein